MLKDKSETNIKKLKHETKILDKNGNPLLMYNRSNVYFENFELNKRNLETKGGTNKIGFFFADREDLDNYGPYLKERYLNIKKPFDVRDLGNTTDYQTFRKKLVEIGISNKDLAGYDLDFQDLNMGRNRRLGSSTGLHHPFDKNFNMYNTRMATYNFFDVGEGFYIRKLLEKNGFDGVIFDDSGHISVIAFYPEQIIIPRTQFVKIKEYNLEGKVAVFVFGAITIAGILFSANGFTGAVVGITGKSSLTLGVGLFLAGILGLFISRGKL